MNRICFIDKSTLYALRMLPQVGQGNWVRKNSDQYLQFTSPLTILQSTALCSSRVPLNKEDCWDEQVIFDYFFNRKNQIFEYIKIRTKYGEAKIELDGKCKPKAITLLLSDRLKEEIEKELNEGSVKEIKADVDFFGYVGNIIITDKDLIFLKPGYNSNLKTVLENILQLCIDEFKECNPKNIKEIAKSVFPSGT